MSSSKKAQPRLAAMKDKAATLAAATAPDLGRRNLRPEHERSAGDILPDVLAPGLIAVICGTAAGTVAARRGIPYSGPGNKLWPTLRATRLVPPDFDMAAFRDLPRFGLGMTDVVKAAFGADHEIAEAAYDVARFRASMQRLRPRAIGFDGLNAARRFYGRRDAACGRQPDWAGIAIFILPSTSGRASRFWNVRPWQDFAAFVRALRGD